MAIKTVLVAHDFSDPSNRALLFAAELCSKLGASIQVVHVHPDVYDGHGDPALGLPWPTPSQEERYLRFLDTEVQRTVSAVLGAESKNVKHHIVRGDPVKRIASLAKEIGADLICLGSTGKGAVERVLLGSVSQLLLRTSPVPVLTVH